MRDQRKLVVVESGSDGTSQGCRNEFLAAKVLA